MFRGCFGNIEEQQLRKLGAHWNRSLNDLCPEVVFSACRTSNLNDSDQEEKHHNVIAHKLAEKTQKVAIDQAHMPLRLRERTLKQLFGSLIETTDLKKRQKNIGSEKALKAHIDSSINFFY